MKERQSNIDRLEELGRRAERRSRVLERKYRSLLELVPVGIFVFDEHGVLLEVNRSLCEMLGYVPSELLDRTVYDMSTVEDDTGHRDFVEKLFGGERGDRQYEVHETRYRRIEQEPLEVVVRAIVIEGLSRLVAVGVVTEVLEPEDG